MAKARAFAALLVMTGLLSLTGCTGAVSASAPGFWNWAPTSAEESYSEAYRSSLDPAPRRAVRKSRSRAPSFWEWAPENPEDPIGHLRHSLHPQVYQGKDAAVVRRRPTSQASDGTRSAAAVQNSVQSISCRCIFQMDGTNPELGSLGWPSPDPQQLSFGMCTSSSIVVQ